MILASSVLGMSCTWLWLIVAIVFGVVEAMTLGII
ncbi:NfeD family protein, partial [Turicibacter sanguinis]|nr:NfeD family protein [Turicibacter sanguinis]